MRLYHHIILLLMFILCIPCTNMAQSPHTPPRTTKRYKPNKELLVDSARYKITYQCKLKLDTLNLNDIKEGYVVTLIGEKHTKFIDHYKQEAELLGKKLRATTNLSDMEIINEKHNLTKNKIFNEQILIDYPSKGENTYQEYLAGSFKRYKDDSALQNWKLTGESKEYLGYRCHKAVCHFRGRDYEAWYTEDITMPYGPYYFRGLPGLILELYDTDKEYEFLMVGLQKLSEPLEISIYDGKSVEMITRDDFRFLKQFYTDNPSDAIFNGASPIKLKMSPERQKELEKRINRPRPYNPIEKE